ncbi:hypothetical protein L873DRAFT_775922 [Choiromyces venosus 120613-1]|uniref:Ribonuclease H1 N-terminal domain-containing protein n=1 Tax=Choiromyces venosus 120613-1 TaxID=1336337 RepID=A0A3N4JQI4_9PEZI|nr:hypothetical protein L873DRAFT_775922 [Choiromyces venosus 120613-1]
MARRGYYAVARGKPPAPAIYSSWAAAQVVTQKYPDVIFKKFSTFAEAQAFMAAHGVERYRVEITFDVTCMMKESCSTSISSGASPPPLIPPSPVPSVPSVPPAPPAPPVSNPSEQGRQGSGRIGGGREGKQFYVVANGSGKGVYESWRQAKVHIVGQPGICHQAFSTREEADEWLWEYGRMQKEVEHRANPQSGLEHLTDLARELPEPQ